MSEHLENKDDDSPSATRTLMGNRTYDVLKFMGLMVLPALGTLYFGLSQIWGFPYGEEVVGSISVFSTFLGGLLRVSSSQYNASGAGLDGTLKILETQEGSPDIYQLQFNEVPDAKKLAEKNKAVFDVEKDQGLS